MSLEDQDERRAMQALGITADQLRIAKGLDRDKVKWLRARACPEYVCRGQEYWERFFFHLLNWLPTFDDDLPFLEMAHAAMDQHAKNVRETISRLTVNKNYCDHEWNEFDTGFAGLPSGVKHCKKCGMDRP